MLSKREKQIAVAVMLLALLGLLVYVVAASIPRPGSYLSAVVTIRYEDGSELVLGSEDTRLFNLLGYRMKQYAVMLYNNKKLWGVSTKVNLRFNIDPPDKSLQCQYWVLYWIEVNGLFYSGTRSYSSLIGFTDIVNPFIAPNPYSAIESLSKWDARVSNPYLTWNTIGSFVEPFYQEATSSVWVDLSTFIANPKDVTDALSGFPLVGSLADTLGARLSSKTVTNGYNPLIVSWDMTGPDFYVRLKRSNFDGLSVHLGDFSVGAGEFMRMWEGDTYTVTFYAGYFFRYQDITGEWSGWKVGKVPIAALKMNIAAGSWYLLEVDITGEHNVQV